jgi:hypothetical protein
MTLQGSDAETCELTFTPSDPSSGTLSSITDQSCQSGSPNSDTAVLTYTHDSSDTTSDSFTYQVCDDAVSCATAAVSITITPPQEPPLEAQPTITLDPTEGAPETEVTVQGSGWIPGDTVSIHFAVAGNEVAQATVGDDGSFVTTFTVPSDAEIGEQLVIAGTADVSHQADAAFQVTEPVEIRGRSLPPWIPLKVLLARW